jgi:hypothetical protein
MIFNQCHGGFVLLHFKCFTSRLSLAVMPMTSFCHFVMLSSLNFDETCCKDSQIVIDAEIRRACQHASGGEVNKVSSHPAV